MNDLSIFPADIAAMSVGQLAQLPVSQKAAISRHLDEALMLRAGHAYQQATA